jgi:hypothetical protein
MAPEQPEEQIAGMRARSAFVTVSFAMMSIPMTGLAQPEGAGWQYQVQAYALFPNMKGETGIADLPTVTVDEDPQDIFDNLQMGAMLYLEARNDTWAFSSDVLYMDLGSDIEPLDGTGIVTLADGHVDVSQTGWELAAMRRLAPWFELGLGVTYNQIDVDVDLSITSPLGTTDRSAGLEENWIDPTIVMRGTWPIDDKWFVQARGNIGGFGVGSDLMWQVMADVGYRPSEKWFVAFGYRVIDIDYENGSGLDRFVYDVRTFGPQLKLGINF